MNLTRSDWLAIAASVLFASILLASVFHSGLS